jgi:hypothetical protein
MENIEDVYNLYFITIMIIHIDNQSDTKLSIKLFIYESGPNHEEMEDVLCPKLRYLTL